MRLRSERSLSGSKRESARSQASDLAPSGCEGPPRHRAIAGCSADGDDADRAHRAERHALQFARHVVTAAGAADGSSLGACAAGAGGGARRTGAARGFARGIRMRA